MLCRIDSLHHSDYGCFKLHAYMTGCTFHFEYGVESAARDNRMKMAFYEIPPKGSGDNRDQFAVDAF